MDYQDILKVSDFKRGGGMIKPIEREFTLILSKGRIKQEITVRATSLKQARREAKKIFNALYSPAFKGR